MGTPSPIRRASRRVIRVNQGGGRGQLFGGAPVLSPAIGPPVNVSSVGFEVTHLVAPKRLEKEPKDRHCNPDTVPPVQCFTRFALEDCGI